MTTQRKIEALKSYGILAFNPEWPIFSDEDLKCPNIIVQFAVLRNLGELYVECIVRRRYNNNNIVSPSRFKTLCDNLSIEIKIILGRL